MIAKLYWSVGATVLLAGVMALSACRESNKESDGSGGQSSSDAVSGANDGSAAPVGDGSAHVAVKVPRVHPPRRTKDVKPRYPEEARKRGIQGVVVLELTIEPTGKVSDARIIRGVNVLDEAAIEAAMQWEYEQPLLGSRPVSITLIEPVRFYR